MELNEPSNYNKYSIGELISRIVTREGINYQKSIAATTFNVSW